MRYLFHLTLAVLAFAASPASEANDSAAVAKQVLQDAGVSGGLVVHAGCGNGRFTAALHAGDGYLVQGLAVDPEHVAAARDYVFSRGLTGKVTIDRWPGGRLPYIDNLVDLVVVSSPASVSREELLRVLVPGGIAITLDSQLSTLNCFRKPWPDDIDQWPHYLHGPDNNAVARDKVVGPPRRIQWVAGPRWTRHHNTLNSISSLVTAGGRVFFIVDEASPANMDLPGRWSIVARGAFNGVLLWRKPLESWASYRQRFRTGPPQLPRLLVASPDRLYAPLGLGAPVSVIDAATGETVGTLADTTGAEEMILVDTTLFVLKGDEIAEQALTDREMRKRYGFPAKKTLVAVSTASGKSLWHWSPHGDLLPLTLASDGGRVYIRTDAAVICLDARTGTEVWRHAAKQAEIRNTISYCKDNLVVADGVVLTNLDGMLTALSAQDGHKLWECEAGSAFHEPIDIFVIDGLVWHKVSHQADPMRVPPDQREARDLHTGELKVRDAVPLYLLTPGHHFRCYRPKATERFIIMNKRGVEMVDLHGNNHSRNNWVRGTCQYGVMPANGLLYVPPSSCGCFTEAVLRGFLAYAPASSSLSAAGPPVPDDRRLEAGAAYGDTVTTQPADAESWPAYRQNQLRSGVAATAVPAALKPAWCTQLGGSLTQPVVTGDRVVLADRDAGIVYALDAGSGEPVWKYFAGGRVDSPPTLYNGMALFGSGDGRVTCVRQSDGAMVWRFLAAPADLRAVAFDRLESPWPISGSVLVMDGVAYVCAGRSTWIDQGMLLYALDPETGRVLRQKNLKSIHPEYRQPADTESTLIQGHLWTDFKTFTQPDFSDTYSIAGGLNDVPVSDGSHLFLRHLMFDKQLEPQVGHKRQLFSTSSLLDSSEHHRTGWGLGSGDHDRLAAARYKGGASRFHFLDQQQPAPYRSDQPIGVMLVFDEDTVWGVRRTSGRGLTQGKYMLFQKGIDADSTVQAWNTELQVRPRAMLKAGKLLLLGVMPVEIPENDPHAAYDGRMGGAIQIRSAQDGSLLGEYPLPAPVTWDGMAAAGGRLYASSTDGRLVCWFGE